MKLEKRSAGEAEQTPVQEGKPAGNKRQPVVVYIMVLFIAAFLLMALSFLMHQRSNTEALGQLQNSVNAMQAVQETQEKVIALQEELSAAEDRMDALEKEKADSDQAVLDAQREADALLALYTLQQEYLTEDYDGCRKILQAMEDEDLVKLLPKQSLSDATSPADRYQQLKEAVLNK